MLVRHFKELNVFANRTVIHNLQIIYVLNATTFVKLVKVQLKMIVLLAIIASHLLIMLADVVKTAIHQ